MLGFVKVLTFVRNGGPCGLSYFCWNFFAFSDSALGRPGAQKAFCLANERLMHDVYTSTLSTHTSTT